MFLKKEKERKGVGMKQIPFYVLVMVSVFCCQAFITCSGPTLNGYIRGLREMYEQNLTQPVVFKIFKKGKQSIPYLIAMIDEYKEWGEILSHPENQNPIIEYNESAFIYAYLVEVILGRESLDKNVRKDIFLGSAQNYVYWEGVIVTCDSKGQEVVDEDESDEIFEAYNQWWEKNQQKSLRQLRADWKRGIRPLSGSKYCWK